jgi:hypothetical protein
MTSAVAGSPGGVTSPTGEDRMQFNSILIGTEDPKRLTDY